MFAGTRPIRSPWASSHCATCSGAQTVRALLAPTASRPSAIALPSTAAVSIGHRMRRCRVRVVMASAQLGYSLAGTSAGSKAAARGGERDICAYGRARCRRAVDREAPVQHLDAVLEAEQAGAPSQRGAATPVVIDFDVQRSVIVVLDGIDLDLDHRGF